MTRQVQLVNIVELVERMMSFVGVYMFRLKLNCYLVLSGINLHQDRTQSEHVIEALEVGKVTSNRNLMV